MNNQSSKIARVKRLNSPFFFGSGLICTGAEKGLFSALIGVVNPS
jgi:hypothetical protein